MGKIKSFPACALISVFALSTLISCGGSPKKETKPLVAETKAVIDKKERSIQIRGLGITGDNSQARFSPKGDSLLFVSENRPDHKNAQIYLLNLETKSERRLTYQDGENAAPSFDPNGTGFVYSSNTDELKEDPKFLRDALANLRGDKPAPAPTATPAPWASKAYDVYWSNWEGTYIERLTQTKNYDSEAQLHPTADIMVFSSLRTGKLALFSMDRRGENQKGLPRTGLNDGQAVYSPDGKKLIWIRYSESLAESQIFGANSMGRAPQSLTSAPALHLNPRWFPDGEWILFSSNRGQKANFDLFVIKADGSCLHQLTYHAGQDLYPDISPDGKWISFTSDRGGSSQLYLMSYKKPQSCPEDAPAGKIKK